MKLKHQLLLIMAAVVATLTGCDQSPSSKTTIGIIEPLQHKAMTEIVAGFKETLEQQYHQPVNIVVENAQGDANLERAIIQKMRDAQYTMIVPIGVSTTQMTLAMTKQQNVVSLASDLSDTERKKMHPCRAVAVHDEISANQILAFIHQAFPNITHLTLIHSASDKVMPEVEEAIIAAKKYGITLDHRMVSTLPELYTITQSLPASTEGIFVLKDSMIVSGIATLAKTAANRHIPLITSDQGSVQDGAGFALGVHERDIGVIGGQLASAILNGKPICELPIATMQQLTVFINKNALSQSQQNIASIEQAAKALHFHLETTDASR